MWYAVIAILVLILDQVTKVAVAAASGVTHGTLGNDKVLVKKLIDGFLEIEYCENNNGMMGIFSFLNNGRLVFIIATVIILGGITVYLFLSKNRGKWLNTAIAFIISGALGNFIDRLFTDGGYVRDMIHVIIDFGNGEIFPYIFNVADIALVVGAIMLIIEILFISKDAVFMTKKRREKLERKQAEADGKIAEAKKVVSENLEEYDFDAAGDFVAEDFGTAGNPHAAGDFETTDIGNADVNPKTNGTDTENGN